ncbi:HD domain-containing phosphohydrolase [Deinococcus radiomollis]|uniref:HD domain-containing phosphohydrolase n=1 Tax=Deinococcus radiomollis TaxID=468916 RepID=UPI0038929CC9
MVTLSPSNAHPFDRVDDVIFILDTETRFTFVNAFALNAWGKELHELLGRHYEDTVPTKASRDVMHAFRHALKTRQRTEFETFGLRHRAWINLSLYPSDDELIVHVKPLPKRTGAASLTEYDALTSCLTRAAFQDILKTLPLPYALAIIDLNLLKNVNTLLGHSGGDAHIRTVAHTLREALPAEALMCRWGGDEFVVLTPGTDLEALGHLLDQTNALLPCPLPDTLAFTTGLAVREQGTAYERAFALADEQLQLRKEHLRAATPGDRETASFVTFSQELEALKDPGDLIQHALNRLLNLLDFDQASYGTTEGETAFFTQEACSEGVPASQRLLHVRVSLPETGLIHTVYSTRATAWSTDYPNTRNNMPSMVAQGVKSAIVTPVLSHGEVIGTIVLRTLNRWQTITPHMRKIVELTALRLEHALELRRAVSEVKRTLESGLQTLGIVLEAKDLETHGHTRRAAVMAVRLGEALGLSPGDLDHLGQGAYLHDLGKLCIPDEILRKPGSLSPEEWSTMQSHVVHGYDLATRIPGVPQNTLSVIRSHHERWDGTGYPDRLTRTDIPLAARIFAVCDVYDALISDRPYKTAWSHEDACAEIERQAGRHFDPEVVQAFLHLTRQHPYAGPESPEQHAGN